MNEIEKANWAGVSAIKKAEDWAKGHGVTAMALAMCIEPKLGMSGETLREVARRRQWPAIEHTPITEMIAGAWDSLGEAVGGITWAEAPKWKGDTPRLIDWAKEPELLT